MPAFNTDSCSEIPSGPPAWHYKCRECEAEFELPVPGGPTEERSRTCPNCKSKNIERVKFDDSEVCPPGG